MLDVDGTEDFEMYHCVLKG